MVLTSARGRVRRTVPRVSRNSFASPPTDFLLSSPLFPPTQRQLPSVLPFLSCSNLHAELPLLPSPQAGLVGSSTPFHSPQHHPHSLFIGRVETHSTGAVGVAIVGGKEAEERLSYGGLTPLGAAMEVTRCVCPLLPHFLPLSALSPPPFLVLTSNCTSNPALGATSSSSFPVKTPPKHSSTRSTPSSVRQRRT
jgi:hypothetical protein